MLSRLEVETRQADRVHREELAEAEGILHSGMEYPQKDVFSVPVMRFRASRVVLIIVKQGRQFPSSSLLSASRCLEGPTCREISTCKASAFVHVGNWVQRWRRCGRLHESNTTRCVHEGYLTFASIKIQEHKDLNSFLRPQRSGSSPLDSRRVFLVPQAHRSSCGDSALRKKQLITFSRASRLGSR